MDRQSPRLMLQLAALLCCAMFALGVPAIACDPVPDASRISVAGGSLTEILYAMDEQGRIVGVDRTSNYPAEALALPQLGYVRDLSAEGVLSLEPTVVLAEHDAGPPGALEQLGRVGLPVILVPEELSREGIIAKVRCVANVIGEQEKGEALIAQRLATPVAETKPDETPQGLVILTLTEGAPIAAGVDTTGQGFLGLAGARNVMDFEGWKPVSAEAMAASQPEFLVITERGLAAAGGMDALLEHPALRATPAAQNGRVLALDGMAMLGFGLRTVESAQQLREFLEEPVAMPAP